MTSLLQAGVARSSTDVHAVRLAAPVVPDTPVREGILQLDQPLSLHLGGRLEGVRVAWRVTGNPHGPLVAALGGISAGRAVADIGTREKGWWCDVIGRGKALDTERFQVLGIDFLGGSGATTGPRAGQTNFPSISSYDQAEILRRVLEHLRASLAAIIGASYGGMVALAFAERYPQLVKHAIAISGADRPHPMATAWRSVQRAMVRYAARNGDAPEGLRLARALAMATYRSPEEFATRFGGAATRIDGRFQFPVESYLLARGDAYAATYVPEAFVCLSESIDLHHVDPARIRVPVTLVAIIEDQLIPLADMRSLKARLGGQAALVELSSLYGHDAFLKEGEALQPVFAAALEGQGGAT
jgi:homoserine O-acetyltransferase/O-succinyltransferase